MRQLLALVLALVVGIGAAAFAPEEASAYRGYNPVTDDEIFDGNGKLATKYQSVVTQGTGLAEAAQRSPTFVEKVGRVLSKGGYLPTALRVLGPVGLAAGAAREICTNVPGIACWLFGSRKPPPSPWDTGEVPGWLGSGPDPWAYRLRENPTQPGRLQEQHTANGDTWTSWADSGQVVAPSACTGTSFGYPGCYGLPTNRPLLVTGSVYSAQRKCPNVVGVRWLDWKNAPGGIGNASDACWRFVMWAPADTDGSGDPAPKTSNDPGVPDVAAPVPFAVDWATQIRDALRNDPDGGSVVDWLRHQAGDDVDDPSDLRPKVLAVARHETYDQYVARLRAAGVVGTVTRVDLTDATLDPSRGPSEAVRTSPKAGVRLDPETEVRVYTNPETAQEPGTEATPEPGTQPGSGGSPTIPAINLDPLKQATPCDSFPFGVPCWVSGALGGFNAPGHAPSIHWDLPFDLAIDVDLEAFRPATEIYKPVMLFGAILAMAWGFMRLAMGGNDGGTPD